MTNAEQKAIETTVELCVERGVKNGLEPIYVRLLDHGNRLIAVETVQRGSVSNWSRVINTILSILVGVAVSAFAFGYKSNAATKSPATTIMKP